MQRTPATTGVMLKSLARMIGGDEEWPSAIRLTYPGPTPKPAVIASVECAMRRLQAYRNERDELRRMSSYAIAIRLRGIMRLHNRSPKSHARLCHSLTMLTIRSFTPEL